MDSLIDKVDSVDLNSSVLQVGHRRDIHNIFLLKQNHLLATSAFTLIQALQLAIHTVSPSKILVHVRKICYSVYCLKIFADMWTASQF